MALEDIIGKIKCGADGEYGAGLKGCLRDIENLAALGLLKPNTYISDFTRAGLRALQTSGKLKMLQDIFDATWANEDLQIETSSNKRFKSQSSDSIYEVSVMFTSGLYFQKVLKSLAGKWDVLLADEDETSFVVSKDGKTAKGLYANVMVHAYTPKQGTTTAKTQLTIQFLRPSEFDKYLLPITAESAGFSILDLDDANQVDLSIVSGAVAASTNLRVKTVLSSDKNTFVGGLAVANFLVKVNGQTVTPSAVTAVPDEDAYDLTIAALAADDKIEIVLYNSTDNERIIKVGTEPDDVLYKSWELVEVAAAA